MRWLPLMLATLLTLPNTAAPAAARAGNQQSFADKEFVILKSTPSFAEATRSAAKAASDLGVELNLRGLFPDLRTGLTFSKRECERGESPYPCYVPRGRGDGTYVSVEWSSEYPLFAKGLYLVMIASYAPGATKTRRVLAAARRVYPEAYAKRAKVYVGGMR